MDMHSEKTSHAHAKFRRVLQAKKNSLWLQLRQELPTSVSDATILQIVGTLVMKITAKYQEEMRKKRRQSIDNRWMIALSIKEDLMPVDEVLRNPQIAFAEQNELMRGYWEMSPELYKQLTLEFGLSSIPARDLYRDDA